MITRMSGIRLYGPKTVLPDVTSLLQDLGMVHIEAPPPEQRWGLRLMEGDRERSREQLSLETLLEKVRQALLLLPLPEGTSPPHPALIDLESLPDSLGDTLAGIFSQAEALHSRHKSLQDQIAGLVKYERVIRALAPLVEGIPSSPEISLLGITIDRKSSDVLPLIDDALRLITGGDHQVMTADVDSETTAAVIITGRRQAGKIQKLLRDQNLRELQLPAGMSEKPLKDALQDLHGRLDLLPPELEKAREELSSFSLKWHGTLTAVENRIDSLLRQVIVTRRILCSRYTFLISGWIPAAEVNRLEKALKERFGGTVTIEEDKDPDRKETPVLISNPPLVRPFEVFTRLLPLPSYGSIDPAPFLAFFFPLFYGMILGDIGYGFVIMALSALFWKSTSPSTPWRDLAQVFFISSIYSVFFGVLYGEFFATLGERFHLLRYIGRSVTMPDGSVHYSPLLFDRIEAMTTLLLLAVVIGAAHVFLGILLGIYSSLRSRRYRRLLSRTSLLLSLLASIACILSFFLPLPSFATLLAAAVLAVSLVTSTTLNGLSAPIEIVSALGNILSYTRILAIGMASVILGLVANRLGELQGSLAAGLLVALSLHIVNLVLALFSPTIHSMRLHFVEFFGKFCEAGGKPFHPFGKV